MTPRFYSFGSKFKWIFCSLAFIPCSFSIAKYFCFDSHIGYAYVHKRWEKNQNNLQSWHQVSEDEGHVLGQTALSNSSKDPNTSQTRVQHTPSSNLSTHAFLMSVLYSLFHFHLPSKLPPVTFPNTNLSWLFLDVKPTA